MIWVFWLRLISHQKSPSQWKSQYCIHSSCQLVNSWMLVFHIGVVWNCNFDIIFVYINSWRSTVFSSVIFLVQQCFMGMTVWLYIADQPRNGANGWSQWDVQDGLLHAQRRDHGLPKTTAWQWRRRGCGAGGLVSSVKVCLVYVGILRCFLKEKPTVPPFSLGK